MEDGESKTYACLTPKYVHSLSILAVLQLPVLSPTRCGSPKPANQDLAALICRRTIG
jgi:hypothetical protein